MDRRIQPRLVRLHKIEAARCQIESAIWLWFVNGDIVSIYTLAAAAHRMLLELGALWGARAWPSTAGYLCAPAAKEAPEDRSRNAATYFQHAKDNETYEISEQWTELHLFDAVMAYGSLSNDRSGSDLMSTFVVRFGVEREDLFVADAFSLLERRISAAFNLARLKDLSRIDFLKEFLSCVGPAG